MLVINKLLITLMSFCYRAYSVTFNSISSKDCVEVHEKKKKVAVLCFHPPQKGTFMLQSYTDGKEMYKKACKVIV